MDPQTRKFITKLVVICFVLGLSRATCAFGAISRLPEDEVQALRDIAKSIGKTDWDFSVDPCDGGSGWYKAVDNGMNCSCNFTGASICHVVSIVLKSQSLPGSLPQELIKLPYLQEFDLTRNYVNGSLPSQWGSTKLTKLGLNGNRISGSIPKEFGNISTLTSLTLEGNRLSGSLPPELGNLTQLERMHLSSNQFSGPLSSTLAKLTALKEFRISDNNFTGNIPDFIMSWTNLEFLWIQASGLEGPIPSSIVGLVNLTELRISDLRGTEQPFPPVSNLTTMKILILRSCNISDELPEYLVGMNNLQVLDLSFNKLRGEIPSNYNSLSATYMYLTENLLNGSVPDWIIRSKHKIDLSYNNFTSRSVVQSCQNNQATDLNLFRSSSNETDSIQCLKSSPCPSPSGSLRINCGGREVTANGITYESDGDEVGPSKYVVGSSSRWALSNTGHFLNAKNSIYFQNATKPSESYRWTNTTSLSMENPQLYMNARLSPISLTYYGFCLRNGKYRVDLHFAEIMFTHDNTFVSLGRRVFDVYIQGKLELKDFNIADEADGVGKATIKTITDVVVASNTLEIRLYWAGKGTTGLPIDGVYGPLISAISAEIDDQRTLSAGVIAAIVVVAVASLTFLVIGILWWKGYIGRRNTLSQDLQGLDIHTGTFTLRQIKAATNNFDVANKIGEGGFGPVYKGFLSDGTVIAVKQLSSKSKQGNREFVNEIGMISALQHPHLVKLYGCCTEGNQLLLIYEYLENNSLARALFSPEEHRLELDWPTRQSICVGIARGLAYLHEESRLKIVHRDIKATNVLLDKDLRPKISDFGLAKLDEEDDTHISTRIAGTYGYMAPEYALHGYLTDKADVYSFGIVALEIVSGRSNISRRTKEECFNLLDWAHGLKEKGSVMELVDSRLGHEFDEEEAMVMINVAFLCTNTTSSARPAMSAVVSMLEGRTRVEEAAVSKTDDTKFMAMKKHFEDQSESSSLIQSMSMDSPPAPSASSSSGVDLYPISMGSSYWESRDKRS